MSEQDNSPSITGQTFPDAILKSQFFWTMGSRTVTGEQRLMLAVLADAINLVQHGSRSSHVRRTRPFAEARDWIFASGLRSPLAFEDVCDALKINAEVLRLRLDSLLSGDCDGPLRLRIREATRAPRMVVNRRRRRSPHRSVAKDGK